MAPPTRPQIESTVALPTFQVEVDQGAGYVTVTQAEVISINAKLETSQNQDNAFAFGTVATTTAVVNITDSYVISNWQNAKVRIRFGFDTSDKVVAFEGILIKRQRQDRAYQYECEGFNYQIARKKIYTGVFYRRPIATKTTATSIEDYTIPGSRPGILNRVFFTVGGRPYEQPGYATDPALKFWYSFDESIVKPRWAWVSGEDAWEETQRLVRAAGGQLYQNTDGVIYYKQPLSFGYVASGAILYDFHAGTFQSITEDASTVEQLDTIKASFVERVLQPMQEVYSSSTPKLLPAGELTNVPLEMQYPVYTYASYLTPQRLITSGAAIKATFFDGRDATQTSSFTVVINVQAAQLVDLTFNNATGEPISLNKVTLHGRPVTPGSENIASYTNGTGSEMMVEDNVYIQSFAQAYRLVRMYYDFYHVNRAIVTLDGVGYDPDRYLGEVVTLTHAEWGLSLAKHRIIALDYTNGDSMRVSLAPISGLPTRDDVFIVGNTYSDGTVKMVSY